MMMRSPSLRRRRAGNIVVLTAAFIIMFFGVLALAVDIGYLHMVQTELQRTADSSAIAATWELLDESVLTASYDPDAVEQQARTYAAEYASSNPVAGDEAALAVEDVVVGQLQDPTDPTEQLDLTDPSAANAVQVRVRRVAAQNGEVALFFARALGMNSQPAEAIATAAFLKNIDGFRIPSNGENVELIPFALDLDTWNLLLQGTGSDDWTWDAVDGCIESGPDGILEANLFPQGTGSPGNRGTVDIGSSNNSTADIVRQILYGISPADLAHHGGELRFDADGKIYLNGDPGISAGMKSALASIKGQPRAIPVFSEVNGPGNNATYTIVRFIGIRIMDVKLTGCMCQKRVIVQPAIVKTDGVIPGNGTTKSYYVYSPVWLVR